VFSSDLLSVLRIEYRAIHTVQSKMTFRANALQIAKKHPVDPAAKKTVVITGASSGIGLSAAVALSKTGWRVICGVRNMDKMNKAIQQVGSVAPGSLESMELDLASFASVKVFAKTLLGREDVVRIDALLLNAGLGAQWAQTQDGYELGFQSCHLSHHLLVRLLETRMIESAPSRIVVVASHAHKTAPNMYDWPKENHKGFHSDSKKGFSVPFQYSSSKLANLHFARILGHRLQGKGVTIVSLHPGVVNSNLWPWWMVGRSLYMLNTEEGAATSVMLVVDPRFNEKNYPVGTYWCPSFYGEPHQEHTTAFARNEEVAQKLWDETEKIIVPFL